MRARPAALLALSATLLVADYAAAPTAAAADPQLTLVTPRGARRGTEATFTFHGNRLADAAEVLFYEPGFTVTAVEPDEKRGDKQVKVTATIAADARPGEHLVQLRTAGGLTEFVSVYVGTLPELEEAEPNGDAAEPQTLDPAAFEEAGGVTLTGRIDNEDLDHFALHLDAGQALSAEVEGIRLGSDFNNAFDPAVEVLDTGGRELAASDDTPLTAADPVLHFTAPEAGTYLVRVRHAEFRGSSRSYYRMHLGVRPEAFPRPLAVYPAGGPLGEATEITFLGDAGGPFTQTVTPAPGAGSDGTGRVYAVRDGAPSPSPLPFRASAFPNVLEAEPNDGFDAATPDPGVAGYDAALAAAGAKAMADAAAAERKPTEDALRQAVGKALAAVPAPTFTGVAFNGVLAEPGETDWFAFAGRKGQTLRFDAFGRRVGSAIDPELDILGPDGKHLKGVGDKVGLDAQEDFKLPADGVYRVQVRDHLKRGGPLFVYRLEVSPAVRTPTLSVPRYGRYGQGRQRIVIPRGGRYATQVIVNRDGLGGALALEADRLPAGVSLVTPPIPGNQSTWPALFVAAEDAPLGGSIADLRAFPAEKPEDFAAAAKRVAAGVVPAAFDAAATGTADRARYAAPLIQADFVRYRNNEMLWGAEAPGVGVAVVEKLPFSVEVLPPAAPLVRDGVLELQVRVHRDEGFDGEVKLEFPQRTPGVGCDYQRKVPGGEDTAVYPLNANGKAATGTFPFYVLAFAGLPNELNGVTYGGGTGTCASELVDVTVADTPFTLKLAKGAVRRTESSGITATLENADFAGTATVTLKGLPDGLTCPPVEVTAETESFVFAVAATDKAPTGTRKGLVAEVTLPTTGFEGRDEDGVITFNAGTTDLRVDDAPKQETPKPEAPKVADAAEKKPAPPKPLSRLEQLRLEAERAAAGLAENSPENSDPAPGETE